MPISFKVAATSISDLDASVVVLPLRGKSSSKALLGKYVRGVDAGLAQQSFTGAWGSAVNMPAPEAFKADVLVVVGLGENQAAERESEALRRGLGVAVTETRRRRHTNIGIDLRAMPLAVGAAVEAVELAMYAFTPHSKKLADKHNLTSVTKVTLVVNKDDVAIAKRLVATAVVAVGGVTLARDLVNQPANHMAPETLVAEAKKIAIRSPQVRVKIFNRAQALKKGFTAFLAVAQGSTTEPYVIHLTYTPKRQSTKTVALVGKGVTFDSGGLSLKPASYMENMKCDMAGAAVVLGVFAALVKLQPNVTVHGIIAACENMVSGAAYRPGDVITAMNGKTIEVLNTDAEGRITLADALTYAEQLKPDAIIDLATLTGACMVGLGENVAGLWGNDEQLMKTIQDAGKRAGERLETMPMPEEYAPQLESMVADLRNIGTSNFGGAVTAAMFLHEFVEKTPWVHLDIAGPAYNDRPQLSYLGHGGTGFGVRTLLEYLTVK